MRWFQGKYFYLLEVVLFVIFIFTGCNQTQKIPTGGDIWGQPDSSISTPGQGPGQTPSITPIPMPSVTPISLPAPVITAVTPDSGSVGTQITIAGNNFGNTQGSSVVTFNGTAALPSDTILWTNTQIVIKIPSGATTGNIYITVNNKVSNGIYFNVLFSGVPTIISLSPSSGKVGSEVTIQGMNFGDDQNKGVITFNGVAVHDEIQQTVYDTPTGPVVVTTTIKNILRWTNTHITIKVPTYAQSGEVKVTVNSVTSNGIFFQVLNEDGSPAGPPATITSLSPNSGYYGTQVTINGSGFGNSQGTSTVTFNLAYATNVISWSNTQIVVNVPNNATSGNVVVTVNGVPSNDVRFDVLTPPNPTIKNLSPSTGTVGTTVTITGVNFGNLKATSFVLFNYSDMTQDGLPATDIISWTDSKIVANVPAGAVDGNVVVKVGSAVSNKIWFDVLP